ncbi:hypothetical protein [Thiosulfatimonas sediminis]|uniref:hypothetical protein n=1 Tax=Thiosulfatimonas sediminis TaxID=2675054 RepID=UPI0018D94DF9|nr:hypothetical protein [Thiosulfatimonas sediminis]
MSDSEKLRLEHQAARLFMRRYEKQFGVPMRHIWHNTPRKPDVSCYLDGEQVDLEIAHLYGSEEEAKQVLGRSLSDETLAALRHLQKTPPNHRLLEALNQVLCKKSAKCYESKKVWLVIRNLNPHWQTAQFAEHTHLLLPIERHPFEQIWLLSDHDQDPHCNILRLDDLSV